MEIDKLLENLAVISQILKTPSLTNQIEKDPEFGKKIKEFEQNKLDTIADFGVGLNMVKSIRHWSIATKVCDKEFNLTEFGKKIFSKKKSFDPYLEKSETLWLFVSLEWQLNNKKQNNILKIIFFNRDIFIKLQN